jgi:hypothetical protein
MNDQKAFVSKYSENEYEQKIYKNHRIIYQESLSIDETP